MRIKYVAAVALLAMAMQALPADAHGRKGQRGVALEQLGLSEEQQAQLEAVRTDFDARAQALHEAHRADELAVLTEEQLATLTAYQSEGDGRGYHRVDLGLSEEQIAAIGSLDAAYKEARATLKQEREEAVAGVLTDEQLATLEALRNAPRVRGQRISLAEQLGLSQEQQTELTALRGDFAESARALHEAHRADEQAVLTEEQLAALTAYQSEGRHRGGRHLDLGLSDEQVSAINDLDSAYREARAALYAAHQEAVAALLNEEQLALLEALQSAPPFRRMHRVGHSDQAEGHSDEEGDADGSLDELADAGTDEVQSISSSLQWGGSGDLTTAVESTNWGYIKSLQAE
jgi:hypothetical protein